MCLVSYLNFKWYLPHYCRGLEKDFQQLQFKFQTLKSNFTVCSTINICSIYEDRMHFVSMPMSHIWERFPVTSASFVQVYIRVLTDELLSPKKKKGCTTWHHLRIINKQKHEISAKKLRGASPVWQLHKGRNIPLCSGKHRPHSPAKH